MDYLSDNEIIKRCQQGDMADFKELVSRYQQKIMWVAYQMIGNYEEARDISQEAFIRVYRALSQFKLTSNFYTWLYRIVVNLCIDFLRKQKHASKVISFDDVMDVKSSDISIDKYFEKKELVEEVKLVLQELPPMYKIIIILRDIEGFSCKEIENIVDCNHNTVRWRLFRARQLFKKAWETHQALKNAKKRSEA